MAHVKMCTATGEEHGLMGLLPNSVPFEDFKQMTAENRAKCQKEMKEDARMVRARYINHQEKNGRLEKPYCRWPGEQIQLWKLIPNYEYTLPMGFIKEVNECRVPVRSGLQSVDGVEVNKNGAPLEKDQFERTHELVPTAFK